MALRLKLKMIGMWTETNFRRGMLVEGQNVRAVICFGKGLNVYEIQHKKGPRLRKERNYRLKLIDNPYE